MSIRSTRLNHATGRGGVPLRVENGDQAELHAVIFAALNVHPVFQLLRRIALRRLRDLRTEKYHSGSMASHTGNPEGSFGDSGSEPKSLIP